MLPSTAKPIEVSSSRPSIAPEQTYTRNSQYSNQIDESRLTPDSQFTDSKSSEMYKFTAHLYGENKPFVTSVANLRIESAGEFDRVNQEFKRLKTSNNFTHYIIETSHPLRFEIEKLPGVQDQIV